MIRPAPASGQRAVRAAAPAAAEPSWARVLATTIELWVVRRLGPARSEWRRAAGRPGRSWSRGRTRPPGRRAAWRWPLAVLAVAAVLTIVLCAVTGVFTRAAAPVTGVFTRAGTPGARASSPGLRASFPGLRASSPGHSPAGSARSGSRGPSAVAAATAARSQAAAWITGQVSDDATIACDPVMCAALQARGLTAGRLLPLRSGSAGPAGADLVVTSSPAGSQLAGQYAPAIIASFGSGASRIDVRAVVAGGPAGYQSALQADLAARRSAGSQLLGNGRIKFTTPGAAQLRAGEVDSRLLATLAALSSQYTLRVTAFGDAAPGAAVLLRDMTVTVGSRGDALTAALAMVSAQRAPYLPAHVAIIHPAGGPAALRVQFAAPSPLGLLTAVLDAAWRA